MSIFSKIGDSVIESLHGLFRMAAASAAVAFQAGRIHCAWNRTIRSALVDQVYQLGVSALPLICGVAFLVGTLVVASYQTWVGRVVESKYLALLLVTVIVRQLAPLLVSILLVARGGSAIASELGLMSALGEVRSLDAQGLDPLAYLMVPRVCGMLIASLCLCMFFIACAIAGAFAGGQWTGAKTGSPLELVEQVLLNVTPADALAVVLKSGLCGWVAATICCVEGLKVQRDVVLVPRQTVLAVQRAVIVVVLLSTLVSWISYF